MEKKEKRIGENNETENIKQLIYEVLKEINDRESLNRIYRHTIYIKNKKQ